MDRITPADYAVLVEDFCSFMSGQGEAFIKGVERDMLEASGRQEYEEAARLRDRLGALTRALERNTVVFDDSTDADVIGVSERTTSRWACRCSTSAAVASGASAASSWRRRRSSARPATSNG